jgi:hypothetical protein
MPSREIQKNARAVVRITPGTFEGHELINIRVYAPSRESGELMPTKQGVALNIDLIPELIQALEWSLSQPCEESAETEVKLPAPADLDILANKAWEILSKHGAAVHWDSAEKMVLPGGKKFSKWDLHYVLATRRDLFESVGRGCFRARRKPRA